MGNFKHTSINSGMLDKLNNFVITRHSLGFNKLGFNEFEEIIRIVDKRRPYCSSDFVPQYFIPDLSTI